MDEESTTVSAHRAVSPNGKRDPRYLAFFECFNEREFFQAHEALEPLWLEQRGQANDHFYKGLIQLAGAFVHLQKKRLQPAVRLLQRARSHLETYPPHYAGLDVAWVRDRIGRWLSRASGGHWPPERYFRLRLHEGDFGTGTASPLKDV